MRRIKARIQYNKDNEVTGAFPDGYSCYEENIAEDWHHEGEGYIEIPLKKATSRNKGNSLERDVAKAFSQWLYGRPDILARTPLSGGWEGSKLGDITANPAKLLELKLQMPKLYVECKNREGLLSETFFNWLASGSPKTITDWIEDTKKKAGLQPWFLVLKGTGTDPWVLVPQNVEEMLHDPAIRFTYRSLTHWMFPLKQLENVYVYSKMKQAICL